MCEFAAKCKNEAEFVVIHKAVGKRPEFKRDACKACASRIGSKSPDGPLIDDPGMESVFFKLEKI
jgi:hypothetical protein